MVTVIQTLPGTLSPSNPIASANDPSRVLALASTAGFAFVTSKGAWQPAPHFRVIDDALQRVAIGSLRRLIVQVPIRHGKSELITGNFPAFYLGHNPDEGFMLGTYNQKYARKWGRFARNKLNRWGEVVFGEGIRVADDSSAADEWAIQDHTGGYFAAGVGAGAVGRGGKVMLIDDPFATQAEASSQNRRDVVDEWYRGTFRTRLAPGGAIIVVMSRWDEDDLIGRLLKREREEQPEIAGDEASYAPEPWTVIDLPGIALEDGADGPKGPGTYHDALGRKPGEALWPRRWPLPALLSMKHDMGTPTFSANVQGRPLPATGGMFQSAWFRRYRFERDARVGGWFVLEDGRNTQIALSQCLVFQVVDLAISEREEADFFVIGTFAYHRITTNMMVVSMFRRRLNSLDQIKALQSEYLKFRPEFVAIESVAYQASAVQHAVAAGLPARAVEPGKDDKVTRAIPAAARYEAGMIWHPLESSGPWVETMETELVRFPKSKKDQVDTIAYAALLTIGEATRTFAAGTFVPGR